MSSRTSASRSCRPGGSRTTSTSRPRESPPASTAASTWHNACSAMRWPSSSSSACNTSPSRRLVQSTGIPPSPKPCVPSGGRRWRTSSPHTHTSPGACHRSSRSERRSTIPAIGIHAGALPRPPHHPPGRAGHGVLQACGHERTVRQVELVLRRANAITRPRQAVGSRGCDPWLRGRSEACGYGWS